MFSPEDYFYLDSIGVKLFVNSEKISRRSVPGETAGILVDVIGKNPPFVSRFINEGQVEIVMIRGGGIQIALDRPGDGRLVAGPPTLPAIGTGQGYVDGSRLR